MSESVIHHGDCLDVMAAMDAESVDAIVTDPPYDLTSTGARNGSPRNPGTGPFSRGFMGKAWDGTGIAFRPETWAAAYRVAKPSSYLLAFGGTRTVHRLTTAIEDAGWIIRDMLVWAYASGFPKSKASLKPAWEPIVMARKPGPLRMLAIDECRIPFQPDEAAVERADEASQTTVYADGFAAKPGRRVKSDRAAAAAAAAGYASSRERGTAGQSQSIGRESRDGVNRYDPFALEGRWPANVVLTDPIFDGGWDGVVGGGYQESTSVPGAWAPRGAFPIDNPTPTIYGDSGTYSRFFLVPKADRGDREPVLGGLPACPTCTSTDPRLYPAMMRSQCGDPWHAQTIRAESAHSTVCAKCGRQRVNVHDSACKCSEPEWVRKPQTARRNVHPTVKPTDLMRHLVRLVTPTGGIVLDPFLGSGTTALAAEMEGFEWIGIEKEAEYVAIAEARLNGTQRGLGLPA